MALNINNALKRATVKKISNQAPEIAQYILQAITPELVKKLKISPKTNKGKGGNTNYAENIIVDGFKKLNLLDTIIHPNGTQNPPDILLAGKYKVELKSVKKISDRFAFNDSLPDPFTYYCLFVRNNKRFLVISGDVLLTALNSTRVISMYKNILRVRKIGRTSVSNKSLEYYYPRQNLFIRNFLNAIFINGYFDFDNNTIWVSNE